MTLKNAAFVFAAGWTLFWSSALGLTTLFPLWLALVVLACGLGMIPLAVRKVSATERPASKPTVDRAIIEP